MAWANNLPSSSSKIRDLPSILSDNWKAIEENDPTTVMGLNQWVVHLLDRSTIGGNNTPTRIDDVGQLYCRNDGSFNELYFEDSQGTANEIQLTEDGKLGAAGTQIVTQDIQFGSATGVYAAENLVAYWARYNDNGFGTTSNVVTSSGVSISTVSTSVLFTMSTAYASVNDYVVIATADSGNIVVSVSNRTTTSFRVTDNTGTPANINVIVIGAIP